MKGTGTCSATSVDIDKIVDSFAVQLQYHRSTGESYRSKSKSFRISRVNEQIRKADRNSYGPIIASIGPYHHGNPALFSIQKHKWNCLYFILEAKRKKKLQDYLEAIVELQEMARGYYSDEIHMDDNEFIQMLVLDASFLIVILCGEAFMPQELDKTNCKSAEITEKTGTGDGESRIDNENDAETSFNNSFKQWCSPRRNMMREMELCEISALGSSQHEHEKYQFPAVSTLPWFACFLAHDLLLLENQIPFFVVNRVSELLNEGEATSIALCDKLAEYIEDYLQFYPKAIQCSTRPAHFHHMLHLCHMYFRPSQKSEVYQERRRPQHLFYRLLIRGGEYLMLGGHINQKLQKIPSHRNTVSRWRRAKQYHEAGIQFSKKEFNNNNPHSLLDIKFTNGSVEIPCLMVDENTAPLFRNLIALEQSCPPVGKDFTAYVAFISQLTSTQSDVTFLGRRGILVHELRSDEEVCLLFAALGKNVDFDMDSEHYLRNVFWMMEDHYQNRVHRWMAWLFQHHFSNPWLVLAVLAAAVVLLCTVVQTLFAFLAYYKPTSGSD